MKVLLPRGGDGSADLEVDAASIRSIEPYAASDVKGETKVDARKSVVRLHADSFSAIVVNLPPDELKKLAGQA